jgi:hypothetical protein
VRLGDVPSEDFERRLDKFVRTYGQLVVGPFGRPEEPYWPDWLVSALYPVETPSGADIGAKTGELTEPVESYREHAQLLAATIRTAERARRREAPFAADRPALDRFVFANARLSADSLPQGFVRPPKELARYDWGPEEGRLSKRKVELIRLLVTSVVNWWLTSGKVRQLLSWDDGEPAIELRGGLWGILGMQLLHAIADGLEPRCAACGEPFVYEGDTRNPMFRKRRPKSGQSAWCTRPDCKRDQAKADKRASRATHPSTPASVLVPRA